jgi:hypothetical protein
MAEGQQERAARLFGAADALRTQIGVPIRPFQLPYHERVLEAVRETLGQENFTRAREAGRAMSLEEAVADALGNSR